MEPHYKYSQFQVKKLPSAVPYNVAVIRGEHCYSLNNKITEVLSSGSWEGKRCFIIGGGESLKGFNFGSLDNELTIGINKCFQTYPKIKINYSMDWAFYRDLLEKKFDSYSNEQVLDKWNSLTGIRVILSPLSVQKFESNVHLVRRNRNKQLPISLEEGIYSGRNSGFGALMLAIALKANPIYLLGYDFYCENTSHWHSGYPNRDLKVFNVKLNQYIREFEELIPLLEDTNIQIINLNPNSKLKCFSFDTINNVI